MDIKDVANGKLRKELHTQSVEASAAAGRIETHLTTIRTTEDQLSKSRREVRPCCL